MRGHGSRCSSASLGDRTHGAGLRSFEREVTYTKGKFRLQRRPLDKNAKGKEDTWQEFLAAYTTISNCPFAAPLSVPGSICRRTLLLKPDGHQVLQRQQEGKQNKPRVLRSWPLVSRSVVQGLISLPALRLARQTGLRRCAPITWLQCQG